MARKRKKDTQEYWDKRLKSLDLPEGRGLTSKLSYVGCSSELETLAGLVDTRRGRVAPKGHGPDE
jgi:hypothetical protein